MRDTPKITGTYVNARIVSSDVVHPSAPLGLEKSMAICSPLFRPIKIRICPKKNKMLAIKILFRIKSFTLNLPFECIDY